MTRWKQGLALAGMLAAVVAVTTRQAVVFWVAVALLAGSLILRVVERVRARRAASMQDSLSDRRDE
jgi:hypothetical protein